MAVHRCTNAAPVNKSRVPPGGLAMISIVDDDKSVCESANSLIRSLGYATATFASGEEFLESGCLSDTECLITDVTMPGMSGVDLQSRLLANGNRTPVILVTSDPDERTSRARARRRRTRCGRRP